MHLLVVAESHCAEIEHSLQPFLESGWSWTITACPIDAQALINVMPVDAMILEFTFCEENLVNEINLHHPNLPIISVVDDPFMDTFNQLQVLGANPSLPLSEVSARLPEVVQKAVAEGIMGARLMVSPINERRFSFELDNDKSKITSTVNLLLDACESSGVCTPENRFRIGVALEEALVNAIVHGNLEVSSKLRELADDSYEKLIDERQQDARYAQRRVFLNCRLTPQTVTFSIRDQGPGFDVAALPDPTDPRYVERPCGRGLLLMRTFMAVVEYNDKGNEVTMAYSKEAAAARRKPAAELAPSA